MLQADRILLSYLKYFFRLFDQLQNALVEEQFVTIALHKCQGLRSLKCLF